MKSQFIQDSNEGWEKIVRYFKMWLGRIFSKS